MDKLDKPRLLIKLGTETLTKGTTKISRAKIEDVVYQVIQLRKTYDVILVCSGAIAAAKQFIKLERLGSDVKEKQALAAIGQPFLMKLIYEAFRDVDIPVGQCLLSYNDFTNPIATSNITNTITVLLQNGVLPIINENDTIATEEIKFGDNDKLSALVAILSHVDKLILATNTYGIYDHQQHTIDIVEHIDAVRQYVVETFSAQGAGGMHSKLDAAHIAQQNNIETWIINGHEDNFILKALNKQSRFTIIKPVR